MEEDPRASGQLYTSPANALPRRSLVFGYRRLRASGRKQRTSYRGMPAHRARSAF